MLSLPANSLAVNDTQRSAPGQSDRAHPNTLYCLTRSVFYWRQGGWIWRRNGAAHGSLNGRPRGPCRTQLPGAYTFDPAPLRSRPPHNRRRNSGTDATARRAAGRSERADIGRDMAFPHAGADRRGEMPGASDQGLACGGSTVIRERFSSMVLAPMPLTSARSSTCWKGPFSCR